MLAVGVSHRFESIDARSRRVAFDSGYIKSQLKALCPIANMRVWYEMR